MFTDEQVRELLAAIRDALDSTGLNETGMIRRMAEVRAYTASVTSGETAAMATGLLRELVAR